MNTTDAKAFHDWSLMSPESTDCRSPDAMVGVSGNSGRLGRDGHSAATGGRVGPWWVLPIIGVWLLVVMGLILGMTASWQRWQENHPVAPDAANTIVAEPVYAADHDYAVRVQTYRDACGWAFTKSPACARRAIEYAGSEREMGR